jgi:SEC-C motif
METRVQTMNANKIGRNDPCHCGSGSKYKKCCAAKDDAARSAELSAQAAARAQEAAAKAAEAGDEEEPDSGQVIKGPAQQASAAAKLPRPKLPTPHGGGLPRRGAV